MRVVHLCDTPLSAAPYRLMKVQRIAGVDARLITGNPRMGHRSTWTDLVVGLSPRDEILQVVRDADVVHFHNRCFRQRLFTEYPQLFPLVRAKPQVVQFHSPRAHIGRDTPESLVLPIKKLVVAQYQVREYPEATPVPNAVPIDDPWHAPLPGAFDLRPGPVLVGFSPSSTIRIGWDNKGIPETRSAFAELEKAGQHRVKTRTILNRGLQACLDERAQCDIVVDEVVTGSYHMVSLEALARGQVTVAGLDSKTVDALEAVTGTRKHPWVVSSPKTLARDLREWCLGPAEARLERRCASRAYMEQYWDPLRVAKIYTTIYQGL